MKQKIQEYLEKIKLKKIDVSSFSVKKTVCIVIPLALFLAVLWFFVYFSVREIIVLGNIHYTKEEITETVQSGIFGGNTFVVSHTRKNFSPEQLDLVDQISVEMKDEHTLQVTVQERQLIGYVQYLDCNLYFDSEGRVMNSVVREENTDEEEQQVLTAEAVGKSATSYVAAMKEAPLVKGLAFDSVQLHEILPVEDDSVFNTILGISRMINKYSIAPDAVVFDENLNITLEYADVTVDLGEDKLMEEKLARVAAILPSLEGKKGVLHMEDYDGSSENIVFSQAALTAEDPDEEDDTGTTVKTGTDAVSHEYALVLRESTDQSAADTQPALQEQASGTEQKSAGSQTSGTTQQGTSGQTSGTTQQTTGENQSEPLAEQQTTQQSGTSASGQGSQDIQISKPVLNNLP